MSTARDPVSAPGGEPPTVEELRVKLAQYAFDAQRAELQREIARLADAAKERKTDSD